jgi:adenylate kinase
LSSTRLVITGNPGVGKHTCAKIISETLKADILDINKLAIEHNALSEQTDHGLEVDVKKLRWVIRKKMLAKKGLIIVGHLAPYVVRPGGVSMVAVLRRSPYDLQVTLEQRGYIYSKVIENTSSEILGVSMYDAVKTFGKNKVAEFDTTGKSTEETANEVIETLKKKRPKRTGVVDWLTLVSERDDIKRFFED